MTQPELDFTRQTRQESYLASMSRSDAHRGIVLSYLQHGPVPATAEEIAIAINLPLNSVRSRLTELKKVGLVQAVGKRLNPRTGVNIATWRAS